MKRFFLRPRPIMLFGLGNHNYPQSRVSVGSYMVDLLAKRLGVPLEPHRGTSSVMGYYEPENLLLVKPDTYLVQDNNEALRRLRDKFSRIEPDKTIVFYHETNYKLGEIYNSRGGRTKHNVALHKIFEEFDTEDFYRIGIGIDEPIANTRFRGTPLHMLRKQPEDLEDFYLLNKFPPAHLQFLHRNVVERIFQVIDRTIADIRQHSPLVAEEPYKHDPRVVFYKGPPDERTVPDWDPADPSPPPSSSPTPTPTPTPTQKDTQTDISTDTAPESSSQQLSTSDPSDLPHTSLSDTPPPYAMPSPPLTDSAIVTTPEAHGDSENAIRREADTAAPVDSSAGPVSPST